jgi:hypothetical protein
MTILDTADVSLLVSFGLVLFGFGSYNYLLLKREAAKVQKYSLYKVRDDLIYLVAQDKLHESDHLFVLFYDLANHLIKTTKIHLSLKSFVQAVSSAQDNPANEEQLRKVTEELKNKNDPEVSAVVSEFYRAVVTILLENSLALRFFFRLRRLRSQTTTWFRPIVIRLWPLQRQAYGIWREYDRAASSLQAA